MKVQEEEHTKIENIKVLQVRKSIRSRKEWNGSGNRENNDEKFINERERCIQRKYEAKRPVKLKDGGLESAYDGYE